MPGAEDGRYEGRAGGERGTTGRMHTLHDLTAADFRYRSNGRAVDRNEVMPAVAVSDRVGIVMETGAEGLGAVNFLLSCVIDFYETLGEYKDEFFEYPDFYTFQATVDPADYRMFDVYPDHKNVEVDADAEAILRAVTDRGISILLVPDRPPRSPDIEDITRRSAERSIEHTFLYGPSGQLGGDGFEVSLPRQPVEDWFETTVESMAEPPTEGTMRPRGSRQEQITQRYRRIALEAALERLPLVDDE